MMHARALLIGGLGMLLPAANEVRSQMLYWTDVGNGQIRRTSLSEPGIEILVTGIPAPIGVALDIAAGKMYWTEAPPGEARVARANLDGSNVEYVVTGLGSPSGVAVNAPAGKLYWTDVGTHKIRRANLDGTQVEDLITAGIVEPVRIALDPLGGKMYWTEASLADFMISRANLDGSGVELLVTKLISPSGIGVDNFAGRLYWTETAMHKLQRANLDGSGREDLPTSVYTPVDIALDLPGGKLYWTEGTIADFVILSANLDGTGWQGLVVLEYDDSPSGIAVARFAGDVDGDNDVGLDDFGQFPDCMNGPATPPPSSTCSAFDFDFQGDVDLADFAGFQTAFQMP